MMKPRSPLFGDEGLTMKNANDENNFIDSYNEKFKNASHVIGFITIVISVIGSVFITWESVKYINLHFNFLDKFSSLVLISLAIGSVSFLSVLFISTILFGLLMRGTYLTFKRR